MKVFVVGATGFIGARLADRLERAGHIVVRATRPACDFSRDHEPATWLARLRGCDAAVNAVGIFQEGPGSTFESVHVQGPIAMFRACEAIGVPVVQLSALGADARAPTAFLRTKKRADDALLAMGVPSMVVQPSLVYGPGGASAAMFASLASLPLIPLPGRGDQQVQPVHVDDVVAAIVSIVESRRFTGERVPLVGPAALALRDFLAELRAALGLGAGRFVRIPAALVRTAARWRVAGMLDCDSWAMLERGSTADASAITALLGRPPRPVREFIPPQARSAARREAQLGWLLALLRVSIAVVWLTAAVVSAGLYPVNDSLALLARTGIAGAAAYAALYGAAALDGALGIATLVMRRRRKLWLLQMALVVAYTAIITVALPEQWLHPYGPVVKNLPILAALAMLYTLEKR